jgi:hypothetical protein
MKLPPEFQITITGNTNLILKQTSADQGYQLGYIFHRLLTGLEVADSEFEAFGMVVRASPSPKP